MFSGWAVRRSVPRTVLQTLCRVWFCRDWITVIQFWSALRCMPSVLHAPARTARLLVFELRSCHCTIAPATLSERVKVSWRMDYKLVALVFKCLHGSAPFYIVDELHDPAELGVPKASAVRIFKLIVCSSHSTINLQ